MTKYLDKDGLDYLVGKLTDSLTVSIMDKMMPVGSIYGNGMKTINPFYLFGFGVWEPYSQGRAMVGYDFTNSAYDIGVEGGSVSHTHNIPAHTHAMPHTHNITAHAHAMPHTHAIPNHVHAMPHNHGLGAGFADINAGSNQLQLRRSASNFALNVIATLTGNQASTGTSTNKVGLSGTTDGVSTANTGNPTSLPATAGVSTANTSNSADIASGNPSNANTGSSGELSTAVSAPMSAVSPYKTAALWMRIE